MAKLADDIDEQITRGLAEAREFKDDEVGASVEYLAAKDLFVVTLKSGRRVVIPREDLQDISDASLEEAADVRLEMLNTAVDWPKLDVAMRVKDLADGFYGTDQWMRELPERRRRHAAAD